MTIYRTKQEKREKDMVCTFEVWVQVKNMTK